MRFAALSTAVIAFCNNALAAPAQPEPPSLDVTLSQVENTRVKAVVKNSGNNDVTFVHLNFFKDDAPVQKVSAYRDGTALLLCKNSTLIHSDNELEFEGIRRVYQHEELSDESLTTLAAGSTYEDEFDISQIYDVSAGGSYTIRSEGVVHTASDHNVGAATDYSSNELTIQVDGSKASATVAKSANTLDKRTNLNCYGGRGSVLRTALQNSEALAYQAANAALSGSAQRFAEYFGTTDSSVRQTVAARLQAVARAASTTSSGATQYYCNDAYGYCQSNVLAYTLPSLNVIANCDIYYTYLPALASRCHAQDQATTSLHEFTHAPGVYSPGTKDLGYGYQAATSLSTQRALMNADSYALYANGMFFPCSVVVGG